MKELSLNILDIAQNSIKAKASLINITIDETEDTMKVSISDNGCGMPKELLEKVSDPFCTTRTTRKVGLGIPFFRLAAEQTGGYLEISSIHELDDMNNHGTTTTAFFHKNHIDFTPLGDIISTICTLIQSCDDYDIVFNHTLPCGFTVNADTRQFKEILGDDIPLSNPDVLVWVNGFLSEQYNNKINNQ